MPSKHNIPLPKDISHLNKYQNKGSADHLRGPKDLIVKITDTSNGTVKGTVHEVGPDVPNLPVGAEVTVTYKPRHGNDKVRLTLV